MRRFRPRGRALGILVLLLALTGCGGGIELFFIPTSLRISPGLTTAAPGEVINYSMRLYSLFGTRIPSVDEACSWTIVAAGSLPSGVALPEGAYDPGSPGIISDTGRCEACTPLSPGTYRIGTVRAEIWGTFGRLTSSAPLIIDGNIAENAPSAEVVPQDLKLPPGASAPFVIVSIDRESGRVVSTESATWSVVEGGGSVESETGVYTAPAEPEEEVRVSTSLTTGRTALTYLSVVDKPAGDVRSVAIAPATKLKIDRGRRQRFVAYGLDGDGRYIPAIDAQWVVEGDVGTLTIAGDGTVEFLARSTGSGAIAVQLGGKTARQELIVTVPGA